MLVPLLSDRLPDTYIIVAGLVAFIIGLSCFAWPDYAHYWAVAESLEPGSTTQWALQLAALLIVGAAFALTWTPVLPSMMDEAAEKVAKLRNEVPEAAIHAVSTPVAGLFNAAMGIGEAAGPVFGGLLINSWGFSGMCSIFSVVMCLYGLVLLLEHKVGRHVRALHVQQRQTTPECDPVTPKVKHPSSRSGTVVPQVHLRSAAHLWLDLELQEMRREKEKRRRRRRRERAGSSPV